VPWRFPPRGEKRQTRTDSRSLTTAPQPEQRSRLLRRELVVATATVPALRADRSVRAPARSSVRRPAVARSPPGQQARRRTTGLAALAFVVVTPVVEHVREGVARLLRIRQLRGDSGTRTADRGARLSAQALRLLK